MKKRQEALRMCKYFHRDQKRKYTGDPYWRHPLAVEGLVDQAYSLDITEDILSAALTHDLVEDTSCTLEFIDYALGGKVAEYVAFLTDISTPYHGNRATRKTLDRDRFKSAPDEVKSIKLADMIDNSKSIIEHDPGFAKVYLKEMNLLLPILKSGNGLLYALAFSIVSPEYQINNAKDLTRYE